MSETVTFLKGMGQSWVVPPLVTSITIDAGGAQGNNGIGTGNLGSTGGIGGKGGRVQGVLSVTPGETIYINVGGQDGTSGGGAGGAGGGNNPGGNGGGMTWLSFSITLLLNVLLVASGGGGGGGAQDLGTGGSGGYGQTEVANGAGGGSGVDGSFGRGGTAASGSLSGNGGGGAGYTSGGGAGGGNNTIHATGGGGGSSNTGGNGASVIDGDGGGGGGSYVASSVTSPSLTDNYQSGDGYLSITYVRTVVFPTVSALGLISAFSHFPTRVLLPMVVTATGLATFHEVRAYVFDLAVTALGAVAVLLSNITHIWNKVGIEVDVDIGSGFDDAEFDIALFDNSVDEAVWTKISKT